MEGTDRFSLKGRRGKTRTLVEKFWDYVEMIPFHTCWEWSGSKDEHGYPRLAPVRSKKFGINKRRSPLKASRVSWEIHYGAIPEGLLVCHRCDNPGCVNPLHLFIGTRKDNQQDMAIKGRGVRGRIFKPNCKHCGELKLSRECGKLICLPCRRKFQNARRAARKNNQEE